MSYRIYFLFSKTEFHYFNNVTKKKCRIFLFIFHIIHMYVHQFHRIPVIHDILPSDGAVILWIWNNILKIRVFFYSLCETFERRINSLHVTPEMPTQRDLEPANCSTGRTFVDSVVGQICACHKWTDINHACDKYRLASFYAQLAKF